jgi:quercetin dioxygenase-like cupin family protein
MRTIRAGLCLAASLAVASAAFAQSTQHIVENLQEAKWGPAPPMLPPGASVEVLVGDPSKSVPVTLRIKVPEGYRIPAHSHPTDENVVIVSGTVGFGMGDKLDTSAVKLLRVGGYALMPAGMNHYAYAKTAASLILYAQGPIEFKYVNPADDPRNQKK